MVRALAATSTIVLLGRSGHCPTSTHCGKIKFIYRRQTNDLICIISICKEKDSAITLSSALRQELNKL